MTTWKIDSTHSEIGFKVKHMMFTNVSGKFDKYDGTITTEGSSLENAKVDFTADVSSINTGNGDRDNHLRSADFLNAESNPELKFTATSVTGSGDTYKMTGDLSLNGVTKPVTLDVEFSGEMTDPWGNTKAGVQATGKINRKDWGLNWNSVLETGGVLVSEEVRLNVELQLIKA